MTYLMRCGLLLLAMFCWTCQPAKGCECIEITSKAAMTSAAAVFRGRVEAIERVAGASEGIPRLERMPVGGFEEPSLTIVTFKVTTSWKGPRVRSIRVLAMRHGSICPGYAFEQGREYVVYAIVPFNRNLGNLKPLLNG